MISPRSHIRRGFTLIELLAVITIIIILSTLTLISVRTITNDLRLSSGTNTVTAVLGNARSLAMANNTNVCVVFRSKLVNDRKQVVEAVTAEYTGVSFPRNPGGGWLGMDFMRPIPDVPARQLPEGIKLAAPVYRASDFDDRGGDDDWMSTADLVANIRGDSIDEGDQLAGAVFGVMYGPDGTIRAQNELADSIGFFVDFNNDGLQQQGVDGNGDPIGKNVTNPDSSNPDTFTDPDYCDFGDYVILENEYFCQIFPSDEPQITRVPFFAVYDDRDFRERYNAADWVGDSEQYSEDLSRYVNDYANRIYFNQYTGVVLK